MRRQRREPRAFKRQAKLGEHCTAHGAGQGRGGIAKDDEGAAGSKPESARVGVGHQQRSVDDRNQRRRRRGNERRLVNRGGRQDLMAGGGERLGNAFEERRVGADKQEIGHGQSVGWRGDIVIG